MSMTDWAKREVEIACKKERITEAERTGFCKTKCEDCPLFSNNTNLDYACDELMDMCPNVGIVPNVMIMDV